MAQPIDESEVLERIGKLIDFRCGKCGNSSRVKAVYRRYNTGQKGIEFQCHDQIEFLEISDAMLNAPMRLRGYRPFTKQTAMQRQQKAEQEKQLRRRDPALVFADEVDRTNSSLPGWAALRTQLAPELMAGFRPVCGRCMKPIDRIETFRDPMSRTIIFRFRCHGATEELQMEERRTTEPDFKNVLRNMRPFAEFRPSLFRPAGPAGATGPTGPTGPTGWGVTGATGPSGVVNRPDPRSTEIMEMLLREVATNTGLDPGIMFAATMPPPRRSAQDVLRLFREGVITADQVRAMITSGQVDPGNPNNPGDLPIGFVAIGVDAIDPPKPKPTPASVLLPETKPRVIELED